MTISALTQVLKFRSNDTQRVYTFAPAAGPTASAPGWPGRKPAVPARLAVRRG